MLTGATIPAYPAFLGELGTNMFDLVAYCFA